MYIRVTGRKNKDGSTVRYVQLAHNYWDKEANCSKTQVLYSFGREEQVDPEALKRLVQSINRYLGPEEVLKAEGEANAAPLSFISSRPLGGSWTLDMLWQKLGIKDVLKKLLQVRKFEAPVERALFALIANRALAPKSKLAVENWVSEEVYIDDLNEIPVHHLYRAMDFLLSAQEHLQKEVFFSVADLFNLEVDILYLDTTSTYFETEQEDNFRKYGFSKDKRPDLPQAVIGLAVTREGIPVRCWVWPGSTADMSVVEEVKKDLIGWKLGRVVSVLDRGFVSEDNLKTLQQTGGHYIVGEKLRSSKESVKEALSTRGRYQKVRDNLEVKEIIVGDGEARKRYVMVKNPQQAQKDKAQREQTLKKLEQELKELKTPQGQHGKRACELLSHQTYKRYLKLLKSGTVKIDRAKVKEEEKLDGKYLLRTSDDTLATEDVALGFKQLSEVEAAFRSLKNTLELRPVYHRLEERIRAHVLLCWLALLLVRVSERATGESWDRLRQELQKIHLGEFSGDNGQVWQRTELTPTQQGYFKRLNINPPPRFFSMNPKKKTAAE